MNPRIQELARQAGFTPGVMGLNRFTYFDPEKFAQLIVEECASRAEAYSYMSENFNDLAKELREMVGGK